MHRILIVDDEEMIRKLIRKYAEFEEDEISEYYKDKIITDAKALKFVLGIETDQTVINSSPSALERDVFRNQFLKSKGWKICRVWSRDWWHNSNQVMSTLVKEIEKQMAILHPVKKESTNGSSKKLK